MLKQLSYDKVECLNKKIIFYEINILIFGLILKSKMQ